MLLDIQSWWSAMGLFEQIYWTFAIPSTLIFVIILVMTFVGGDLENDMGDADADVNSDGGIGFQFFTLKNLVGFFTIFSWAGLACIDGGIGVLGTVVISFFSGLAMMLVMGSIFYFMGKLTDSGTLNLRNSIGGLGEVYLPMGAKRAGFGKIQINVQGGLRTIQSLTDDEEDLPVGAVVEVVDVINDQILLVTKSIK